MFFERKAFVEFLDFNRIKITTPFIQKQFELNSFFEEEVIDLINLKKNEIETKFYLSVLKEKNENRYTLEAYANGSQLIGDLCFSEGGKFFKTKILEDD